MIEHMAIAQLLRQQQAQDNRRSALAENEFYRTVGTSRIERIANALLSMRLAAWRGRGLRAPSPLSDARQAAVRRGRRAADGAASMRNCRISDMSASASSAS